ELRGELDDAHLAAERLVDARHLQADDAAADDEQSPGELGQLERIARIHDARVVRKSWQTDRFRARSDDALIEVNPRLARAGRDFHDVRSHEARGPLHDVDFALLREQLQSAGELAYDARLPRTKLFEIDLGRAEIDAVCRH